MQAWCCAGWASRCVCAGSRPHACPAQAGTLCWVRPPLARSPPPACRTWATQTWGWARWPPAARHSIARVLAPPGSGRAGAGRPGRRARTLPLRRPPSWAITGSKQPPLLRGTGPWTQAEPWSPDRAAALGSGMWLWLSGGTGGWRSPAHPSQGTHRCRRLGRRAGRGGLADHGAVAPHRAQGAVRRPPVLEWRIARTLKAEALLHTADQDVTKRCGPRPPDPNTVRTPDCSTERPRPCQRPNSLPPLSLDARGVQSTEKWCEFCGGTGAVPLQGRPCADARATPAAWKHSPGSPRAPSTPHYGDTRTGQAKSPISTVVGYQRAGGWGAARGLKPQSLEISLQQGRGDREQQ